MRKKSDCKIVEVVLFLIHCHTTRKFHCTLTRIPLTFVEGISLSDMQQPCTN